VFSLWISGWRGGALYPLAGGSRAARRRRRFRFYDCGRRWRRGLSSGVGIAATGLQRRGDGHIAVGRCHRPVGLPPVADFSPSISRRHAVVQLVESCTSNFRDRTNKTTRCPSIICDAERPDAITRITQVVASAQDWVVHLLVGEGLRSDQQYIMMTAC
jgi:hypothetical protein